MNMFTPEPTTPSVIFCFIHVNLPYAVSAVEESFGNSMLLYPSAVACSLHAESAHTTKNRFIKHSWSFMFFTTKPRV